MEISEIKETVDILTVLDWLELEAPGSNGKIRSPHHEDNTPSLHIYEDQNEWHDFSTGKGGDVLDLVQYVFGCRIRDAIKWLECRIDEGFDVLDLGHKRVINPRQRELTDFTERFKRETQPLTAASSGLTSFIDRRWPAVNWMALELHGVRCTYNALHIPHFDTERRVIGVKTRDIAGNRTSWKGSTFTSRLYGAPADYFPQSYQVALILEGEPDVWAADTIEIDSAAVSTVVAYGMPSGAGTWKDDWNHEILQYRGAIICTDRDEAGEEARLKISKSLNEASPWFPKVHLKPEEGKDLAEWLHLNPERAKYALRRAAEELS
jgi:5S rRNA maturation endonuclease (ribonuclease M5)